MAAASSSSGSAPKGAPESEAVAASSAEGASESGAAAAASPVPEGAAATAAEAPAAGESVEAEASREAAEAPAGEGGAEGAAEGAAGAAAADEEQPLPEEEKEEEGGLPEGFPEVSASMPLAWRDPTQWVDLELERAGLPTGREDGELASPWGSEECPVPDHGVLWPHAALHEHRSRPFAAPRGRRSGGGQDAAAQDESQQKQQVRANRDRLTALWQMSSSHGISWDELDEAYVAFAKAGQHRHRLWTGRGLKADAHKDLPGEEVQAAAARRFAEERARKYLQKYTPKDESGNERDPTFVYPSRYKKLSFRIYMREKKRWLGPWRPGRLTAHLQQLVAARMVRRETEERALGLRRRR